MKRILQTIALLAFISIPILAQKNVDRKTVIEKYDEVSRLETREERSAFLFKQTYELIVALWHENIDRKTKGIDLSAEQKEILNLIRTKFITVEFSKLLVSGKTEVDTAKEYKKTMAKAKQLLGQEMMRELFYILGDSKTLKK